MIRDAFSEGVQAGLRSFALSARAGSALAFLEKTASPTVSPTVRIEMNCMADGLDEATTNECLASRFYRNVPEDDILRTEEDKAVAWDNTIKEAKTLWASIATKQFSDGGQDYSFRPSDVKEINGKKKIVTLRYTLPNSNKKTGDLAMKYYLYG